MKRMLIFFFFLGVLGEAPLRAESFNPADAEPLMQDRALLLQLEPGTRRARLQVKNHENGEWEVVQVVHLEGEEGFLKMRVPDDLALEDCRAEVSMTDPFPYRFYKGETEFEQKETGGIFAGGGPFLNDAAGAPEGDRADGGGAPDTVQESDLWQWRDDTLYFFNQLRGLQVFDLSEPAKPEKLAALRMPSVGDQMYILDDDHVLLLANYVNFSAYGWFSDIAVPHSSMQQTEAIVVKHSGDQLEVVSRVAFDGDYLESRLVGQRLYLVTRLHEPAEDEEGGVYWRQGLVVNAVDLSEPASPVSREPLELIDNNGWFWNSVVTASPEHLLVTTSHYDSVARLTKSRVHVIPIGRDLETMEVAHTVGLKAHLPDKFKLRIEDDILTTVTEKNVWRQERVTYVESFDLSGERSNKLDELILAPQERLHATRFDGNRLYVVTFFVELRKDPLFVIDLSDPNNLKSLGELEIPGWSTYLVPEGDRLLSVGIEENRVAISLFDVADPNEPSLIERVYPSDGRSWSEANWDEKAVGYLTDQDLLLLPIQTRVKGQNGYEYKNLMQIVDVHDDDLEVRGAIEHEIQGRRATALGSHVVSISGRELLVVDAADRDEPALVAELPLAWDAYKVLEMGEHLWQIGQGYSWGDAAASTQVRVTTKAEPDEIVGEFELAPGAVAGLRKDGDRLYLARLRQWSEQVAVPVEEPEHPDGEPWPDGEEELPDGHKPEIRWEWIQHNELHTDIYDVGDVTNPLLLGSYRHELGEGYQSHGLDSVVGDFVQGHLLWRPRIQSRGYHGGFWFIDDIAFDGGVAADIAFPGRGGGYYYSGYPSFDKISLLVLDVTEPADPELVSETVIDPRDWAEFGPMVLRGDNLLLSYKESHYERQQETTIHRYELREVSFADTTHPVVGEPVSLPGILEGVYEDNGGDVLFTSAPEMDQQQTDPERIIFHFTSDSVLQASIYDGQQAFLVSQVEVPGGRYTPTVVLGDQILKPGADDDEDAAGLLIWQWRQSDDGGELVRDGLIELPGQPSQLALHEGLLFAEFQQVVSVIAGTGDRVVSASLSGPVYTQELREIEVNGSQTQAWIAVGSHGIETLDLSEIGGVQPLEVAAQVEGWSTADKERVFYVLASGDDYVGALAKEDAWRFRGTREILHYEDWAMARLNPTGEPESDRMAPGADIDLDGASNVIEFLFGTSPVDEFSLRLPDIEIDLDVAEGDLVISSELFAAIGNKNLEPKLEWSKDLKIWQPMDGGEAVNGVSLPSHAEAVRGFYRIVLEVAGRVDE